ncbi:MAG: hypothetical protein NC920_06300 [Candidatus Omnitrophica bacterium]|nr:hypothetical protein [Candidatus Omnitrophota bacterium]
MVRIRALITIFLILLNLLVFSQGEGCFCSLKLYFLRNLAGRRIRSEQSPIKITDEILNYLLPQIGIEPNSLKESLRNNLPLFLLDHFRQKASRLNLSLFEYKDFLQTNASEREILLKELRSAFEEKQEYNFSLPFSPLGKSELFPALERLIDQKIEERDYTLEIKVISGKDGLEAVALALAIYEELTLVRKEDIRRWKVNIEFYAPRIESLNIAEEGIFTIPLELWQRIKHHVVESLLNSPDWPARHAEPWHPLKAILVRYLKEDSIQGEMVKLRIKDNVKDIVKRWLSPNYMNIEDEFQQERLAWERHNFVLFLSLSYSQYAQNKVLESLRRNFDHEIYSGFLIWEEEERFKFSIINPRSYERKVEELLRRAPGRQIILEPWEEGLLDKSFGEYFPRSYSRNTVVFLKNMRAIINPERRALKVYYPGIGDDFEGPFLATDYTELIGVDIHPAIDSLEKFRRIMEKFAQNIPGVEIMSLRLLQEERYRKIYVYEAIFQFQGRLRRIKVYYGGEFDALKFFPPELGKGYDVFYIMATGLNPERAMAERWIWGLNRDTGFVATGYGGYGVLLPYFWNRFINIPLQEKAGEGIGISLWVRK